MLGGSKRIVSQPAVLNYLLADGFIDVELRSVFSHETEFIDLDVMNTVLLVPHLLQDLALLEITLVLLQLRERQWLLFSYELDIRMRNHSIYVRTINTSSGLFGNLEWRGFSVLG